GHRRRGRGVEVAVVGVAGGDRVAAHCQCVSAEAGRVYAGGGRQGAAAERRRAAAVIEVHRAGRRGDQGGARCDHADGGGEGGRLPKPGRVDRGGQRGRGVGVADDLGQHPDAGREVGVPAIGGG